MNAIKLLKEVIECPTLSEQSNAVVVSGKLLEKLRAALSAILHEQHQGD